MMKQRLCNLAAVVFALSFQIPSAFAAKALVYQGPGSCEEGCTESSALMASLAGLEPVIVGPQSSDPSIFEDAVVWIQPGGKSTAVGRAMSAALKDRIREFVRDGGGYVGFCAGAFYATSKIGTTRERGLGILPGRTELYRKVPDSAWQLPITWNSKPYSIYWEGGPFIKLPSSAYGGSTEAEVIATYADGTAATVRARFGHGRVFVTGLHPEAPQSWRDHYHLEDTDGTDFDLAVEMIRWARK